MPQMPRYREVADDLRNAIKTEATLLGAKLADRAKLPTEPELSDHFDVSRGTIRQALRELAAEGLIETRGRSGTYVRRLPMLEFNVDAENPHRGESSSDAWSSVVKQDGRTPSHDFHFRIEPASSAVAGRLQVEPGDLVVVREMLRYVDEIPWIDQASYYPYEVAKTCRLDTPHDIAEGTIRRMAEHGFEEDRLEHEISSRPADEEERRRFDLAPGVSVLIYHRVSYAKERRVRYTREILPADRNVITHVTQYK